VCVISAAHLHFVHEGGEVLDDGRGDRHRKAEIITVVHLDEIGGAAII
jgi:hypothetical protein